MPVRSENCRGGRGSGVGCRLRVGAARRPTPHAPRAAFTLLELLVVLLVIGLLAGLVAPQILGRVSDARETTAKAQLEMLETALESYRLDNGRYPTAEQGLAALRERPTGGPAPRNWRGPYLRKPVPLDPWGNAYVYRVPGQRNPTGFDLFSFGRDGKPGGEGEAESREPTAEGREPTAS